VLSKILIILGFLSLGFGVLFLWQRNNPQRLAFLDSTQTSIRACMDLKNPPVAIKINDIDINLPIIPAEIHNRQWDTTTKGVSWLDNSPNPGEHGNSILYAHNWTSLFGNLPKAKPGQKIQINFKDKTKKTFLVQNTAMVKPDQLGILDQTADKRITLYTCAGFMDSKRFVVTAKLID